MPKISFKDWIKLVFIVIPYIKKLTDYVRNVSKEDISFLEMLRNLIDMIWQQQVLEPADGSGKTRFSNLRDLFFAGLATAGESLDSSNVEEALKTAVALLVEFLQDRGYIKRSADKIRAVT